MDNWIFDEVLVLPFIHMTLTPAQIGALRALGVIILMAVLSWVANAENLNGLVGATAAGLLSMVALSLEHYFSAPGTALFGAVMVER